MSNGEFDRDAGDRNKVSKGEVDRDEDDRIK